jgi:hypothetical protein
MDIIFLLYIFKFLWICFEIVIYFIRRKEEKALNVEIVERLKSLENKIKKLNS